MQRPKDAKAQRGREEFKASDYNIQERRTQRRGDAERGRRKMEKKKESFCVFAESLILPILSFPLRVISFFQPFSQAGYSHSMVPGGLLVMSKQTRFTPLTSLMMRLESRPRRS